jgi:pyridoxamine 5'-phosphate oxidase
MNLEELRREYTHATLDERSVDHDPFRQFGHWMEEARSAAVGEPNAMTLSTVNAEGRPASRIVLLKYVGDGGFVFFTDYRSRKGQDLEANPNACLLFFWEALERQVRIDGVVHKVARDVSEEYFLTRPLGSQLGAWTSYQSSVLAGGRAELEQRLAEITERFRETAVPCPPHWGGYRLAPTGLEFWQGRESRLHDRIRYRRGDGGTWLIERLSP